MSIKFLKYKMNYAWQSRHTVVQHMAQERTASVLCESSFLTSVLYSTRNIRTSKVNLTFYLYL
jgi:hypothetical protein